MTQRLKIEFPAQGWKQFLTSRKEMLDAFDRARDKSKGRKVATAHGKVAEAEFRNWLLEFLPKRYGVTAGYIISQGIRSDQAIPHFDVIVYDAINSPVLWIEGDPDTSKSGQSRAIPAEYVLGVLEVKATLNPTSAQEAVQHLSDLSPLMMGIDDPLERYKLYLPEAFVCGLVFFELREKFAFSETSLTKLLAGRSLRGFFGGIVLRGQGHNRPASGRLTILRSETPTNSTIHRSKKSLLQWGMSGSKLASDSFHYAVMLGWLEAYFSEFAFDLIAMMQGTYSVGQRSSWHGMGASEWDP